MFRQFSRNLFAFTSQAKNPIRSSLSFPRGKSMLKGAAFALIPTSLYYYQVAFPNRKQQEQINLIQQLPAQLQPISKQQNLLDKVKSFFAHIYRLFHLAFIFLPPILTLPLRLFKSTQAFWMKLFVASVQRAGVVWIKAFQYMSHRRDVLGAEMADAFSHLRQNAPQHSYEETKQNFKLAYGKEIDQIFDSFQQIPIASGSVSQVYKAVYKGKKVAVKVRHPEVDRYIQRDVQLLFEISRFLSIFSKRFQLPVGEESMKKTLFEQIDFNIEKDNLITFNQHFLGNKNICFPKAFEKETRDSILIESFVEGKPVTYYEQNKHPLNAYIARLGTAAFFEMLMKNNFIHADCHGGNILVEITKQSPSFLGELFEYAKEKYKQFETKITSFFMQNSTFKKLYDSSQEEEKNIREMIRKCTDKVKINLIDVGMVIKLSEEDKNNFVKFIKSVVEGNSQKCASLIYNLTTFEGKKIIDGQFTDFKQELHRLFSVLDKKSIFDIEGIELLVGMLDIIRDHHMKLEGEFATLLTNIMVLESIAKEIDPKIQILKCAVPYFKYAEQNKNPISPRLALQLL